MLIQDVLKAFMGKGDIQASTGSLSVPCWAR